MITLPRLPKTDDELWWVIAALWGVKLPRVAVCPTHVSPFHAVAHAYFARDPNFAVWYASRGSGKSLALAVLGLTKAFLDEVDVTILGGSAVQSQNVRMHMSALLQHEHAPSNALAKDVQTVIETEMKTKITPLTASQTSVRGPHPPLQLLDEVDEMELPIYEASLGQAMEQISKNPDLASDGVRAVEYVVASSTWQNPEGTFSTVIERAREEGMPIFSWCWRELLQEHGGWMSRRFIEAKRKLVSKQMWETEYELGEPSGTSRAFDLDKVEEYFIDYPATITESHKPDDDLWVWEKWQPAGMYAVGADWAKIKDKTVISVVRYDCFPHRIVKARVVNRRPYPVMIGWFNEYVEEYNAVGQHDKTGLGSVVDDYVDAPDAVGGFVFIGRKRTQMLLDYITDFENGHYRLPKALTTYYKAHRAVTVGEVFAPAKWDGHLPDEVASMALTNRAIGKMPAPIPDPPVVGKSDTPRKVDAQFHVQPSDGSDEWRTTGAVVNHSAGREDMIDLLV